MILRYLYLLPVLLHAILMEVWNEFGDLSRGILSSPVKEEVSRSLRTGIEGATPQNMTGAHNLVLLTSLLYAYILYA